jgi:adenosylhomocysteine nucleosidase
MTQPLHIGLLGAMPEEIGSDLSHLTDLSCSDHGDLKIHRGAWSDKVDLSLAWSGWGKVSAARAATRPRFTLPALNQDRLQPQPPWFDWAKTALLEAHNAGDLKGFARPSSGLIATGDRFIGDPAVLQKLRDALPDLQAVEMEGAAVAQVAEQEGIPWLVLRVISDGADETAAQSFEDFVKRYEQQAWRLIEALLQRCKDAPRRCA